MELDFEADRAKMAAEVKKASPYLPDDFNEKAAKIFGLSAGTIGQMRKGERVRLDVAEYILATATVISSRMQKTF